MLRNSSFIKIGQEKRVLYLKTDIHFWSYLAQVFLEWKIFQIKIVEEIKTDNLCEITFFFENRGIYETMWENMIEPGRPQEKIWLIHIACCIPKAKNTSSDYEVIAVFPWQ